MFLLVLGEDVTASRNYIHSLKKGYKEKQHRVLDVSPSDLETELKNEMDISLFGEPTIYFTTGLLGHWSKRKVKHADGMKTLLDHQTLKVINWEDGKSMYDFKLKSAPHIKEFKLSTSVFDLQDMLVPGKKVAFIDKLNKLKDTQDPFMLYTLIHRHARLMLLLSTGQNPGRVNPYVKSKAESQARKWESSKLSQFYLGLTKIDQAVKTSNTPYSIPQSLEILACYYL